MTWVWISAASWRGSAPTGCGSIPAVEATQGTSTQQSGGRLSISPPRFGTLPLNVNGSPPSQARMMCAPYSFDCFVLSSPSSSPLHSPICRSQRRGYSSSGTLNASIRSSRPSLMNHGTYSAKCSDDSVTK